MKPTIANSHQTQGPVCNTHYLNSSLVHAIKFDLGQGNADCVCGVWSSMSLYRKRIKMQITLIYIYLLLLTATSLLSSAVTIILLKVHQFQYCIIGCAEICCCRQRKRREREASLSLFYMLLAEKVGEYIFSQISVRRVELVTALLQCTKYIYPLYYYYYYYYYCHYYWRVETAFFSFFSKDFSVPRKVSASYKSSY
ncbi:hypothetical protein ACE6H2_001066 [Prunus campanulata]